MLRLEFDCIRFRRLTLAGGAAALGLISVALPASADPVTIHLKATNSYEPKTQPAKVGDVVEWINEGGTHTVTPNDGQPDPFPESPVLTVGKKHSWTVSETPRTIKYYCKIHGAMMSGEIVVGP